MQDIENVPTVLATLLKTVKKLKALKEKLDKSKAKDAQKPLDRIYSPAMVFM